MSGSLYKLKKGFPYKEKIIQLSQREQNNIECNTDKKIEKTDFITKSLWINNIQWNGHKQSKTKTFNDL